MNFDSLGLKAELLRAVGEQGYTCPTPVPLKAIPPVLEGHDVMASAQTGTGKTAAFTLPMLQRLSETPAGDPRLRALILTPTRELADQIQENFMACGRHLPVRSTTVFGGVNINPQISKLRRGVDVLIATPGRLIDHMQRRTVDLSGLQTLVLDEADRMLDMGFLPAIERIVGALPRQRQTLLFSATFPKEITTLAQRFLVNPVRVETAAPNSTVDAIAQRAIYVDQARKRELLSWLIGSRNWQQVPVFTRTKHGAEHGLFADIRRLVGVEISTETLNGFEPTEPVARQSPKAPGRRQRQGQGQRQGPDQRGAGGRGQNRRAA